MPFPKRYSREEMHGGGPHPLHPMPGHAEPDADDRGGPPDHDEDDPAGHYTHPDAKALMHIVGMERQGLGHRRALGVLAKMPGRQPAPPPGAVGPESGEAEHEEKLRALLRGR